MRLVLATGDTDLRLAIQLMLSEEPGIQIIGSASDCHGLTALVKSTSPDLALLDWELPGGNMPDVLQELKSLTFDTQITLILLGRKHKIKEEVLQSGADEYMVIGDSPEKMLEVFRQLNIQ